MYPFSCLCILFSLGPGLQYTHLLGRHFLAPRVFSSNVSGFPALMFQEQPSRGTRNSFEISYPCTERIHEDTKFSMNIIYSAFLVISILVTRSVFLHAWEPTDWRSLGPPHRALSGRTEARLLQLSPGYCCTQCEFRIRSNQTPRSLHTARGYLLERILLHRCSAGKHRRSQGRSAGETIRI